MSNIISSSSTRSVLLATLTRRSLGLALSSSVISPCVPRRSFVSSPTTSSSAFALSVAQRQPSNPSFINKRSFSSKSESMGEPIVTIKELESLLAKPEKDFILIDVRERQEVADSGLIPTAHNVPLSEFADALNLPKDAWQSKYQFPKIEKDDDVIVYCRSGQRSKRACLHLLQEGYQAKNYAGSWLEWSAK
eukprot:TRINITY_DN1764_c0_g2_i1.p1 TRINITY_DN1764_c0_g2~~TRINITY_DN1764_c0_g2_i1.p1  ORF type:complete len:192 (-),score=42.32 TRINITY_DN1764_c0_g2_i1:83-658(-)